MYKKRLISIIFFFALMLIVLGLFKLAEFAYLLFKLISFGGTTNYLSQYDIVTTIAGIVLIYIGGFIIIRLGNKDVIKVKERAPRYNSKN